eukprot:snap_masked-scaffold_5-processed-gene-5.34-mRNA-1 protein AED:1.00 eAED:1.00 QI:0/0/0/0/1/1/2/0/83
MVGVTSIKHIEFVVQTKKYYEDDVAGQSYRPKPVQNWLIFMITLVSSYLLKPKKFLRQNKEIGIIKTKGDTFYDLKNKFPNKK